MSIRQRTQEEALPAADPTRLLADLERRTTQLRTAAEVSRAASSILDPDVLIQQVVDLIRERFDLYYVGLFLVGPPGAGESGRWAILRAGTGEAGRQMVAQGHKLEIGGRSMIGWCVANRQARIALDVGAEAVRFDNPLLPETRSELALPLVSRGAAIGALTIQSTQESAFSAEDIAVFQTMADQVATAIVNARLFQERERHITELAILNEIGQAISSALELDRVLETVYQQVSRLFDTTNFYISLYDEETDERFSPLHLEHGQRQPLIRRPAGTGLTGHIIRTRQPLLFRSLQENQAFHEAHGIEAIGERAFSWMGVPLVAADRLVGAMAIQSYEHEQLYGEPDLILFSTIADQVATAIANARLFERIRQAHQEQQRRSEELDSLRRVSLQLAQEQRDLHATLQAISRQAMELLDADGGGVWLWRKEAEELELVVSYQASGADLTGRRLKPGEGLAGRASLEKTTQVIDDYLAWNGHAETFADAPFAAAMAVPMLWQTRVVGVLAATRSQPGRPFSASDQRLAELLAGQAAAFVENARLFQERDQRIAELAVLNEMSQALGTALEMDELLAMVHQHVSRLYDTSNFYIATYQEGSEEWTSVFELEHGQRLPRTRYQVGAGVTGHIIRTRQPVLLRTQQEGLAFEQEHGISPIGPPALSWMGVPLVAADRVVGVMAIQSYEAEGQYDDADLAIFSTIAARVAAAIENLRLLEETRQRAQELEVINEVGRSITALLDPAEIFRQIVDTLKARFGYYFVGIALVEGERLAFQYGSLIGNSDTRFVPGELGLALAGPGLNPLAARTGQPVLVGDVREDACYVAIPELADTRSELVTPITVKGRVIGTLDVQSDRPFAFDPDDVALLQSLASQVGVAIENARLFQTEQQRRQETEALRQVSLTLGSTLDIDQVLEQLLDQIGQVIPYDCANVMWIEEGMARITHQRGYERMGTAEANVAFRMPVEQIPDLYQMYTTRRPHIVPDTASDPRWVRREPTLWIRSWAGAPIVVGDQVMGFFSLDSATPGFYTSEHAEVLAAFAAHAAVAVQNARLFEETRQSNVLLEQRIRELDCLNSIGRKIDEAPPVEEFLQWAATRIPSAMRHPEVCVAAIEFEGQIYGTPEAVNLPRQMVQGLRVGGQRVGQVYIAYTEEHEFHDPESALLGDIVRRISGYIENRRLVEQTQVALAETQARMRETQILQRIGQAVSSRLDLEQVLDALVDALSQELGFTHIALALIDEAAGEVRTARAAGLAQGLQGLVRSVDQLQKDILMDVVRTRRTEVIDGWDERFDREIYEREGHAELVRAFVPLLLRDKALGILEVGYRRAERARITDSEVQLLRSLADQIVVAIENARLYNEERQARALLDARIQELNCLNDIGRKIDEAPPVEEFLQWVAQRIPSAMQYPEACVAAIEFEGQIYGAPEAVNLPRQMVQGLRVGGQRVGQVYIAYTTEHEFRDPESALLGDIVRRVSGYIENRRLFEQAQARAEELAALNEMSQGLAATLDLDRVLESVYHYTARLIDTTNFYLALYDPATDEVSFPLAVEEGQRVPWRSRRAGQGLTEYLIRTGQPLLIENGIADRLAELGIEGIGREAQSWLGVPMVVGGQVIGALAVQDYTTPRLYGEHHRELLTAIASQAAIAIQNARLFAEAQRAGSLLGEQVKVLDCLSDIGRQIGQTPPIPEFLQWLTERVPRAMQYPEACVVAVQFNGQVYGTPAAMDLPRQMVQRLHVGGEEVGRVYVAYTEERDFLDRESALLGDVVRRASGYIESRRLFEQTQAALAETRALYHLSRSVISFEDLPALLQTVVNNVAELLPADRVALQQVDLEARQVLHRAVGGPGAEQHVTVSFAELWDGLAGWVMRENQPALSPKGSPDPRESLVVQRRRAETNCGAIIVVPLRYRDKMLGTLTAINRPDQPDFTLRDQELMMALANQAAAALENARLFEQTQAALAETETLYRASQVLSRLAGVQETFQILATAMVEQLGYATTWLAMVDKHAGMVRGVAGAGVGVTEEIIADAVPLDPHLRNPVVATVYQRQPLIINDILTDERAADLSEKTRRFIGRVLEVPILIGDEAVGVIAVSRPLSSPPITERDRDLVVGVANQAAAAIQNARLLEQLQRRATQLTAAAEVAQSAAAILDLGRLLDETVHLISDQFGFYHAGVFLLDEPGEYAVLRAASSEGGQRMLARGHRLAVGQVGIVGYVAGTGQPRIALDVGEDAIFFDNPDLPLTRSEMALPLMTRGRIIGVLDVQSTEPAAFGDEDVAVLRTMANQLATAIENVRLLEEAERRAVQTQALYEASQLVSRLGGDLEAGLRGFFERLGTVAAFDRWWVPLLEEDGLAMRGLVGRWENVSDEDMKRRVVLADEPRNPVVIAIQTRQTIVINDPERDERLADLPPHIRRAAGRYVTEPIWVGERVVGAVSIGRHVDGLPIVAEDVELARTIAAQISLALENARLFEQTQSALAETESLYRISRRLASVVSAEQVVEVLVDSLAESGADGCMMGLFEPRGAVQPDTVWMLGSWRRDGPAPLEPYTRMPLTANPLPWEMLQTLWTVPDVVEAADVPERARAFLERAGMRATALVPLRVGEEVTGFMAIYRATPGPFSEATVRLYESMADQAAVVLERYRLVTEAERRARREQIIREITAKMRASADLDTILSTAVRELNTALGTARTFVHLSTGPEPADERSG